MVLFLVIRSGDYYMFEDDSEEEDDELTSKDLREGTDKDKDEKSAALGVSTVNLNIMNLQLNCLF